MTLHSLSTLRKSALPYLTERTSISSPPTGPCESAPVVFLGKLWTITGNTPNGIATGTFRVDGMLDRPFSTVAAPDMERLVPFVDNGTLYVFGSSADHTQIKMLKTTDLVTWTAPVTVHAMTGGQGAYNPSICADGAGGYAMTVEVTDPAFPTRNFVLRFLTSHDLLNWTPAPNGLLDNGSFVNCPTMRFYDGKFYVLYMTWVQEDPAAPGRHMTMIARTTDFINWDHGTGYPDGNTVPFVPTTDGMEGNNNSDVDMCEFEGKTYFTYCRGDQTSWLEVSTAVFDGTEKAFLQSFYAVNP